MPLFMDIHHRIEGLTAEAVADAHRKDLETQGAYGVNYLKYWYDDDTGKVFCLVEAPDREAAERVHREAHGLTADEIVEVKAAPTTCSTSPSWRTLPSRPPNSPTASVFRYVATSERN